MTPADVVRPNSVPCGPLSTSIRLMSNRSEILALPWLTWSTTTPTDATAPAEKVWVPMPRIDPPPPVFWPGACWISRLGAMRLRSFIVLTCCRSSWAALATVMEIGTSVTFSALRWAVTMMSELSAGWAACSGAGASCAKAGAVIAMALALARAAMVM